MPQLDPGVATVAWILECPYTGEQCKGLVQVLGGAKDINAFWAEVMGNLAQIMAINLICHQWGVAMGRVEMPLDCLGVIKWIHQGSGKTP